MAGNNVLKLVTSLLCLYALFPTIVSGQSASLNSGQPASLDQGTLDLFVRYPESNDLKAIIYSHAQREPMEGAHVALYSTWFLNGNPHVPMGTIVYDDGRVSTYARNRSNRWKQLPNVDFQLLSATVTTLPGSASEVPLANLVIVSFRSDGKWHTRLYNRKKAPAELTTIYQLTHSVLDAN